MMRWIGLVVLLAGITVAAAAESDLLAMRDGAGEPAAPRLNAFEPGPAAALAFPALLRRESAEAVPAPAAPRLSGTVASPETEFAYVAWKSCCTSFTAEDGHRVPAEGTGYADGFAVAAPYVRQLIPGYGGMLGFMLPP